MSHYIHTTIVNIQKQVLSTLGESLKVSHEINNTKKKLFDCAGKTFSFLQQVKNINIDILRGLQNNFTLINEDVGEILQVKSYNKSYNEWIWVIGIFTIICFGIFLSYILHIFIQTTLFGNWDQFIIPSFIILFLLLTVPLWQRNKNIKNRQTLHKKHKGDHLALALIWFLLVGFFIIYLGKGFFVSSYSTYFFLYIYGVSISLTHLLIFYGALFIYEDPGELAKQIEDEMIKKGLTIKKPLVTCMIAVFNEEKVLKTCIESMLSQSYENIEYIFVNDCSTDRTAEILNEYASKGEIQVIHLPDNRGKKKALGAAVRQAKGSIFAMSDSDSVWDKNAIEIIVRIFNQFPDVGGVSGHGRALNPYDSFYTKIQDPWYEGQFSIRKAFESIFGAITCVSGPLAVFRRDAIYNYIPAWEHDSFLGAPFRFATDRTMTGYVLGSSHIGKALKRDYTDCNFNYNWKLKDKNWDIVYCKSAKSKTIVPDTFKKIIKQHTRWKKSFIRNIFLTGSLYWRKHFIAAILYYLHIFFVLVGPIVAARHLIYLPFHGDWFSPILYIMGIFFVGTAFGLACKIEDKNSNLWRYRPFMSLFSTMILSWLIIYSIFTIKKMTWSRD